MKWLGAILAAIGALLAALFLRRTRNDEHIETRGQEAYDQRAEELAGQTDAEVAGDSAVADTHAANRVESDSRLDAAAERIKADARRRLRERMRGGDKPGGDADANGGQG